VNELRKRTEASDRAFSELVRREYEQMGATVADLRGVLGCGERHATALWKGDVTWTAEELFRAVSLTGFAPQFGDDDRVAFWGFIATPFERPLAYRI
jgi:hypothetical protein